MTNDERAAREWLTEATVINGEKHRATILRLLDRPVMPRPEDVPSDVLREMCMAMGIMDSDGIDDMRGAYRVLHAHLTAPPEPKKVEAWAIVDATGVRATASTLRDAEYLAHIHGGSRLIRLVEADDADA